jgi:hypothetical protein
MLAVMNGRKTRSSDGETVVLVEEPPVSDPDSLPLSGANMCRKGDGEVCSGAGRWPRRPEAGPLGPLALAGVAEVTGVRAMPALWPPARVCR